MKTKNYKDEYSKEPIKKDKTNILSFVKKC